MIDKTHLMFVYYLITLTKYEGPWESFAWVGKVVKRLKIKLKVQDFCPPSHFPKKGNPRPYV